MDITRQALEALFSDGADFTSRTLEAGGCLLYAFSIDGLTSGNDIAEHIFRPVSENLTAGSMEALYNAALRGSIYSAVARPCATLDEAVTYITNGFCLVLFPGVGALAFEAKSGDKRTPSAPDLENTVKGPKDAFVETLRSNTALVRRRLRTPNLCIWETRVGRRSTTAVSVLWIRDITAEKMVEEMKARLSSIDIDALLSPSSVEEYITGSRATAFPLLQYTERADTLCRGLLDGRVGLLVDGLPLGYLAPVDLAYLMESPEDRSRDYLSATAVRILRYLALAADIFLPAVYVAAAMHHPGFLGQELGRVIAEGADKMPFSPGAEALALLIAFELLQESGIHLPHAIGQSVSTIGGIVVGSAAVEAGLLSPVALIAVSIAGICGFVLPNRDLANALRLWRFAVTAAAAAFGVWGIAIGTALLTMHLLTLRSMGMPYLKVSRKDMVRRRLKHNIWRNPALKTKDKKNQKN